MDDHLLLALEQIKRLLGAYENDGKPDHVKEANANRAWHVANNALATARAAAT